VMGLVWLILDTFLFIFLTLVKRIHSLKGCYLTLIF